jgi:hypothetical protein
MSVEAIIRRDVDVDAHSRDGDSPTLLKSTGLQVHAPSSNYMHCSLTGEAPLDHYSIFWPLSRRVRN